MVPQGVQCMEPPDCSPAGLCGDGAEPWGAGPEQVSTVCEATLSQTASTSRIPFHSYSTWLPFPGFPAVGSKNDGTSEALVTRDSWHSPGLALLAIPLGTEIAHHPIATTFHLAAPQKDQGLLTEFEVSLLLLFQ
jgi:hypothetical protein